MDRARFGSTNRRWKGPWGVKSVGSGSWSGCQVHKTHQVLVAKPQQGLTLAILIPNTDDLSATFFFDFLLPAAIHSLVRLGSLMVSDMATFISSMTSASGVTCNFFE